MEYIKIKFGNDFDEIESKFEKHFNEMFQSLNPSFTLSERTWNPQMDMYETKEEIIIRAEIAGVDKESLGVEINSKAVKIYGDRSEMSHVGNATYRLAEIQYGKFERILFLPSPIDTEHVTSSYSNGFLEIRLTRLTFDKTYKIPILDG